MKFESNQKYTTIAVYCFLIIIASIFFHHLINNFTFYKSIIGAGLGLMTPFIYGFIIAYVLHPVLRMFEKNVLPYISRGRLSRRACRYLGIMLTMLCALISLAIFLTFVIPELTASVSKIGSQIGLYANKFQSFVNDLIAKYSGNEIVVSLLKSLSDSTEQIIKQSLTLFTQSLSEVIAATISITSAIFNIVIGFVISVYLWASKETFFAQSKKLINAVFPKRVSEKLLRLTQKSNTVFSGFVSGQLLASLILGVACFIGMKIFGFPHAMLISVIIGITNVIPYFGPFIGSIPSILLLLLLNPIDALYFAIFIIILQQIDGNIISPRIVANYTGLSAVWVVFAVTVFGGLFGIAGMVIGVPLFAVIYMLIKNACENMLERKGLPWSTADYATGENPLLPRIKKRKKK
jgi:predicted PurR-regulated permease PerM